DGRRYGDLLQRLGHWAASGLQPRLAAQRGCLPMNKASHLRRGAHDLSDSQMVTKGTRPGSSEWDYSSIGKLSEALRSRKMSASELLEHTIARIEALDPRLNAIVVRDFDRAKDAAKAADAALARGEQRPLLGIPVTLKEPFNLAGLPTTWGYPEFKDFRPAE